MNTASSALFYLWSRSASNFLLTILRSLRKPRYLLGFLMVVGILVLMLSFPFMAREAVEQRRERQAAAGIVLVAEDLSPVVISVGAFALAIVFIVLWLWRRKRTTLEFSQAEIAYLFPGPITHAAIVHYSLIRLQLPMLLNAAFATVLSVGWNLASPLWARFVGCWLVFAVITLHVAASGFVLTRLVDRGLRQWQRQLAAVGVIAVILALMNLVDPHLRLPTAAESARPELLIAYLIDQAGSGAPYWLLAPLRWLVAPIVGADTVACLLALGPALAVYALHYVWAFRSEVSDHETVLANAVQRANLREDMRKGTFRLTLDPPKGRRDPFHLRQGSDPALVLLWKNLLSTADFLSLRTFFALAATLVGWDWLMQARGETGLLAGLPTLVAGFVGFHTLLLGAAVARQDLRSDLEHADLIKTWPLQGWQIVLGEMLAPTLIVSALLWLCLLQFVLVAHSPRLPWLTLELRLAAGLAVAVILPFFVALQLLAANAGAVLFPAWARTSGRHGIETTAQRTLFQFGQWLFTMLVSLPALLFGLLVYVPASWFIGNIAILPAGLVGALVLAGELAWGINWLGERFDASDLFA